jgi:hypothetical protein
MCYFYNIFARKITLRVTPDQLLVSAGFSAAVGPRLLPAIKWEVRRALGEMTGIQNRQLAIKMTYLLSR